MSRVYSHNAVAVYHKGVYSYPARGWNFQKFE